MNDELFERLLYEEENTTLDFKKEQYRFANASADEKTELLKDILGFANAWRRSEAYILIGVEDVRGGRGKVVGIPATDHLDDHSLQQFVNSQTNRPIRFHYEAFGFEGKQVGIISIEDQNRPIYLKRNFGRLEKEKVYVRRGSSTDPTKPATPDEISQMHVGAGLPSADLVVEFGHVSRNDALGTNISCDAEFCEMPRRETIPDLPSSRQHPFGLNLDPMNSPNYGYYRELANFEFVRRLYLPIRLVVRNAGHVAAHNVRAELTVPTSIDAIVKEASEIPDPPKRCVGFPGESAMKGFKPAFRSVPGEVDIEKTDERFLIEIDCGDLQPGREIRSEVFYIGKISSGDFPLRGSVFADNLPKPKDVVLTISVSVTKTAMTVDELCSLSGLPAQNRR